MLFVFEYPNLNIIIIMKASYFLVLLLLIAVNSQQPAKTQAKSTHEAANKAPPIVTNEKQPHKQQPKVEAPPKETPLPVKPAVEQKNETKQQKPKQPAEPTFTFDDANTFESHGNISPQLGADPQLAAQIQRQAEIEQQKHKQEVQEQQNRLNPWIVDEMQSMQHQTDGIVTESFQFILDPQAEYEFRWDPPKTQMLSINVLVFQINDNGEIQLVHDAEESEFVDVAMREEGHSYYNPLGHVYVSKIFRINFDTDFKYFKFTSHIPNSVFIVVDLEKTHEVIPKETVAQNRHFQLPLEKLRVIEEEVQSGEKIREHTYKYEWGFLDNQYAHDSRLLGLTGFELVVIMGAAVVQLYFIKSLLDNRAVV